MSEQKCRRFHTCSWWAGKKICPFEGFPRTVRPSWNSSDIKIRLSFLSRRVDKKHFLFHSLPPSPSSSLSRFCPPWLPCISFCHCPRQCSHLSRTRLFSLELFFCGRDTAEFVITSGSGLKHGLEQNVAHVVDVESEQLCSAAGLWPHFSSCLPPECAESKSEESKFAA